MRIIGPGILHFFNSFIMRMYNQAGERYLHKIITSQAGT